MPRPRNTDRPSRARRPLDVQPVLVRASDFTRLVGLTGSAEEIAKAAKEYRVFYQKQPGASGADYLMDHSTLIYLMGPDGKFLTYFGPQATPAELAEAIRRYL